MVKGVTLLFIHFFKIDQGCGIAARQGLLPGI